MKKPELFKAWLEALRSGKYKQATGYLKRQDDTTKEMVGHCCLGVLVEIANERGDYASSWQPSDILGACSLLIDSAGGVSWGMIQPELEALVGIDKVIPTFFGKDMKLTSILANMNDSGKYDFNDIAKWLEENIHVD